MPDLEVLFYPFVLTTILIAMVIRHFREKRKEKQKKVSPQINSPPMPAYDKASGFDEGVIN